MTFTAFFTTTMWLTEKRGWTGRRMTLGAKGVADQGMFKSRIFFRWISGRLFSPACYPDKSIKKYMFQNIMPFE
jgi:hypothetical protein